MYTCIIKTSSPRQSQSAPAHINKGIFFFKLRENKEVLMSCLLALSSATNIIYPEGQDGLFIHKAQVV